MATFPTLNPSSRTFTPGEYPHTPFTSLSGAQNRVRNSNVMLGSELRLSFVAITEAEMLSILSHYQAQQGSFGSFLLPSVVWNGTDSPSSYELTGYGWIYAAPPTVRDMPCGGHDVELQLQSVPPEGTALGGLDAVVTVSITPGVATAANGADLLVVATIDGGVAGPAGLDATVTCTITAGTATADANLPGADLLVLVSFNEFVDGWAVGADQTVAVSLAAGTASGFTTDPNFSSVSLLLHMNGSNNSTTFTDSSASALTVTRYGDTKISTAESKWGGASGYFDGTGDYITVPPSTALTLSGDFTIECWVRMTSYKGMILASSAYSNQNNIQLFRLNKDGATADQGKIDVYMDNNEASKGYLIQSSAGVLQTNTWHHVALTRSGSNGRLFVDGIQIGSTVTSWTTGFRCDVIGCLFNSGTRNTGYDFLGYIDDFRITKGVARYTSNFTVPSEAFPNS